MTIYEMTKMLDGNQYREEISIKQESILASLGYAVLYGYSDDIVIFNDGITADEAGEGVFYITSKGIFQPCECECKYSLQAQEKAKKITAIFGEGKYLWSFETEIPYASFEIIDNIYSNGEILEGIVIDLNNL